MTGKIFKQIKIIGFVSFIPFVLACGPLAGYFAGDFISRHFGVSRYFALAGAALGLAASIKEITRIIRIVLKIDKDI